jgi:hypothetical protein
VLADPTLRDEALGILRGSIERAVVHPGDVGPQIELAGEIVRWCKAGRAPCGGGLFGLARW